MTDKNKLADELHAFVAAAPHKYPGHLIELFERVEAALRSSADSEHEARDVFLRVLKHYGGEPYSHVAIDAAWNEAVAALRTEPQTARSPLACSICGAGMGDPCGTSPPGCKKFDGIRTLKPSDGRSQADSSPQSASVVHDDLIALNGDLADQLAGMQDAAETLLAQYDLGAGHCLGVMSDGKARFKGSFLEKLEALKTALAQCQAESAK